jgi:phosphoribosyl 1,2-cyclic phosphate phosphodiesterase
LGATIRCLSSNLKIKDYEFPFDFMGKSSLIIDCGPDFRQQMLASNCQKVDAILFTHEHADHTAGIDDIRPFNFKQGKFYLRPSKRLIT